VRKYILTDAQGMTANGKKVTVGKVTHPVGAPNDIYSPIARLCSDSPLLAVLQNPLYRPDAKQCLFQIDQWEVSVTGDKPRAYTVIKELTAPPTVTPRQQLAFAILALAEVYQDPGYLKWAGNWLSGVDRGAVAAHNIEVNAAGAIDSADALEVLEAHGEISQNDLLRTKESGDHANRVIAVARAAQLAAADDTASQTEAVKLAAQATLGLSHVGKKLDLGAVAERASKAVATP
jgi:hypothetical protein